MEQETQPQQPINTIPSTGKKINKKAIAVVAVLLIVGYYGYYGYRTFTVHYDKLGEISFYKDVNMELKVVLIHENLPLHYVGNSYSVACQSQNTKAPSNDEYELKFYRIDSGWNRVPDAYLGNGLGNDSNSLLKNLADEAKKSYLVKDKNTLVVLTNPNVHISFDGCRTFKDWVLKDNLSKDLIIESTPEFEKCVEQQKKDKEQGFTSYGDCSDLKLTGNGLPVFQNVVANDNGHASFKVSSSVFKNNQIVDVQTNDFGKTWQNSINNKSANDFGIVSFTNTDVATWPLEWHIILAPEDIQEARGFGFRIVSQLTNMKGQIKEEKILYNTLVSQTEIQPQVGDPFDIKFLLNNTPLINAIGPRGYQYLGISSVFSRLGGSKEHGIATDPVKPYGTSYPIFMLGNKIIGTLVQQKGNFVGSRILIATITTSDDKNSYTYNIFLEKIPTK